MRRGDARRRRQTSSRRPAAKPAPGKRVLIEGVSTAHGFLSRLLGLMFRRDLSAVRLWLPRCSSVHTFFMTGPIDLVFLDRDRSVVRIVAGAKPWRFFFGGRRVDSVLELSAGEARDRGFSPGDRIEWRGRLA